MDLQKEREAFEKECRLLCYKGNMVMSNLGSFYNNEQTNWMWQMWLSAKAQAVTKWISVKDKLPSDDIGRVLAWVVEQNSLGKCGFVWNCSHSNGVFSDKFETFQVTHWMPLPDAPQEPSND